MAQHPENDGLHRSNATSAAAPQAFGVLPETLAVVITTYNDQQFLPAAILSVLKQRRTPDEVVVVDDGSSISALEMVAQFSGVRCIRKENGGLSSARNTGLKAITSTFVVFLDADDLLEPQALEAGLACFTRHPAAAMVYGGHRRINREGEALGKDHLHLIIDDVYEQLLTTNFIGMHATVMYRRSVLMAVGGFDESLRMCEDYDVYLRLARLYPVAAHEEIVAEYRRHERNMSSNSQAMLKAVLTVHARHREQVQQARKQAWHTGQRHWHAVYKPEWPALPNETGASLQMLRRIVRSVLRRVKNRLRGGRIHRLYARSVRRWPPVFGAIRYGDFGSTQPIDDDFGYSRGNPVDRYYIENFLKQSSPDIQGRVLEVAEDTYSKRFGGSKITRQDVLHYDQPDPVVTILGDLTVPGVLPDEAFDCIILTQTLQLIFELEKAVTRLHAALKPGGVLLLTVPGISQIERTDWHKSWCWSFTESSIRKLFERTFAPEELTLQQFGNVFAATMFLHGVALEEIDLRKLDVNDEAYPVIVTLRAQKKK